MWHEAKVNLYVNQLFGPEPARPSHRAQRPAQDQPSLGLYSPVRGPGAAPLPPTPGGRPVGEGRGVYFVHSGPGPGPRSRDRVDTRFGNGK